MKFKIIAIVVLSLICDVTNGQTNQKTKTETIDWTNNKSNISDVSLKIESGVNSKELLDYYQFERINYYNLTIAGGNIKNQYFILTSEVFWNSKLIQKDTLANTKLYNFKNGSDTLKFRAMSKSINIDTVKFQFYLPRFATVKKYKTVPRDIYSLRDITSGQIQYFDRVKPITLLAYSLPYEDPKKPGNMYYCQLSKDGIPPENWGEKFGVKHYIIFKIHLID